MIEELQADSVKYKALKECINGNIVVYYECKPYPESDRFIVEVLFTKTDQGYELDWQFVDEIPEDTTVLPPYDARDFDDFVAKGDEWFGDDVFAILSYQKIKFTEAVNTQLLCGMLL